MEAAIETRLPDGPSSRSKIRPSGHGPRAVAFSFGLTARGACLLLTHSFCVPTYVVCHRLTFGCRVRKPFTESPWATRYGDLTAGAWGSVA